MPGPKPFTVELKEQLLEYLLEQAEDWDGDSPDIRIFWHTIERDFTDARGTTWHGKDFEQKMEREEDAWIDECTNEDPEKKRRRGHEQDSAYDKLMKKWTGIWNGMLQKHWQFMVDTGEEKLENVPEEFRKDIKIPQPRYEYDGAKLERVVHAAMDRAILNDKHDLAAAVEQVYKDALRNTKLRGLLEAILTQKADRRQNEEFQSYVKLAKAKIREQKDLKARADQLAAKEGTAGPAPPAVVTPIATVASAPGPHPAPVAVVAPTVAPVTVAPKQVVTPVATPVVVNAASGVVAAAAPAVPTAARPVMAPPAQPVDTALPKKTAKTKVATKDTPQLSPKTSPASKSKISSNVVAASGPATSPASARPRKGVSGKASQPQLPTTVVTAQASSSTQVQDHAVLNPRITTILGDLQFTKTAQQILRKAPDIDEDRLEALKLTLTNHPETKTDIEALQARLDQEVAIRAESQASAGATRPIRSTAGKRRRNSGGPSSMAEAEEDDLLQAQRNAKRRRGGLGADDGGDYHPSKAVRDKSQKKKKSGARASNSLSTDTSRSRGSTPLSDLTDEMDIESTKSAYVDEIVRRRNDEQARKDIVERYGPVSPTDAGDADEEWASMASPTLGATQFDDEQMQQMQLNDRVPSPPPEPAAENDPLRLISGATAQAIARDPGIGRLEAKLDTLITSRTADGQTMNEINAANTVALKDIASVLDHADLQQTRPEFVRLIVQLTQNAAEAAIHAADAAKKAGEMARDVGAMLQQMGSIKAAGQHPATPISEN